MVSLVSLWLPILVSAVLVFLISWVIHVFLTYHWTDFGKLPNQDQVLAALRPLNIPPGEYMVPKPDSSKEMQSPEYQEKLKQGPFLMMTVFPPGPMAMGGQLVQWFVYCVVVSVFAAYVASRAVGTGAEYLAVFRFAGVTAFACYGVAHVQTSIWFRRAWSTTFKNLFDALVYGLVTAGAFGWLWP